MQCSRIITHVKHEWVWGADAAMGAMRLNTSKGQSLTFDQHQQQWSSIERAVSQSEADAIQALDHLYARVVAESARYLDYAIETGDVVRQEWADWLMQWLRIEGREIADELARKIRLASPREQMRMKAAIEAAEKFIDLPIHHAPKTPDDWDLLWDWAKEILPSLRCSFRQFLGDVSDESSAVADAIQRSQEETPRLSFPDVRPVGDAVATWKAPQRLEQGYDRHLPAAA